MSDTSDERNKEQPTRKKRRAAQAAEAKFQEIGRIYTRTTSKTPTTGTGGAEDDSDGQINFPSEFLKRSRASGVVDGRNLDERETVSADEIEEEEEENEIFGSDDDDQAEGELEESDAAAGDGEGPGKLANVIQSTVDQRQKEKSNSSTSSTTMEYQDFAPPPFLQKILSKRQKDMDNIRRQLPVDSRSREEKLADWYRMLSKLDKPVALLSLITPPQQQD